MRARRLPAWILLAASALAAGTAAGAAEPAGELPPAECVRLLRSARLAHLEGDFEAELRELRRAATAFPDEVPATLALLEYHHDHGLPEEEHGRLQATLQRRLGDAEHPLPVSVLQQIARDPEADEALLAELAGNVAGRVAAAPEPGEDLLRLLAGLQERLGQETEAASTLRRLWESTGSEVVAWKLLHLYRKLDRLDDAVDLIQSVEEIRTYLWPTHVMALADAGDLDRAKEVLEEHIGRLGEGAPGPEAAGAAVVIGDDAIVHSHAPLVESLAWRFHDAGREAEAEALFRRAQAIAPSDAGLSAVLLHFYADEEEREARAAALERSWQETDDPRALLDEGTQRLAAGDTEGAFDLLRRAAPEYPGLEAPWYNLGMAAYRLERWSEAAEALARAIELNPDRAASVFFRGMALVNLERCAEAVEALERALELDPSRTQGHYYLAGCLRTLGRTAEAERHRALYEATQPP